MCLIPVLSWMRHLKVLVYFEKNRSVPSFHSSSLKGQGRRPWEQGWARSILSDHYLVANNCIKNNHGINVLKCN